MYNVNNIVCFPKFGVTAPCCQTWKWDWNHGSFASVLMEHAWKHAICDFKSYITRGTDCLSCDLTLLDQKWWRDIFTGNPLAHAKKKPWFPEFPVDFPPITGYSARCWKGWLERPRMSAPMLRPLSQTCHISPPRCQKPPVVGSEPYGLMVEIPPIYGKSVENRGWFMIVWPTWKTFSGFFEIDDEYQWMKSFSLHAIFRPTVFSGMFNLNKEWGHHLWRYMNPGPGHCGIAVLRLWRFRFPPIFMTAILGKRW